MTIISTTVGKNPLEETEYPHCQQKSLKCSTWVQSQKWQNDFVCFQDKLFNITVIQVYAPTPNAEEAEVEWFYEDLQDLLELISKKDVMFIIGELNAKIGSKEIPESNRQIWSWSMDRSRAKSHRVLPRECIGHSKHLFQQHKRRLYTWKSSDDQHQNQTDYILCSQSWRSSL